MGETLRNIVLRDIADERQRQVDAEHFSEAHDDTHVHGELEAAAACYATHGSVYARLKAAGVPDDRIVAEAEKAGAPQSWPWHRNWWKPKTHRQSLVRAAALLVAAIERLDRAIFDRRPFNE